MNGFFAGRQHRTRGSTARGRYAKAISERSGFEFPYHEMVFEPGTGWFVHYSESDGAYNKVGHPQNFGPRPRPDNLPLAKPSPAENMGTLTPYVPGTNPPYEPPTGGGNDTDAEELEAMALLWINVRDYGATGDGTTDDTAAFKRAFDAAGTNGRPVYVPPGNYVIDRVISTGSTYRLTQGQRFVMFGAGINSKITRKSNNLSGTGVTMFPFSCVGTVQADALIIRNLYFDDNRRNTQSAALPAPPASGAYQYEQSACVSWVSISSAGVKGTIKYFEVSDCWFYDPVADCIRFGASNTQHTVLQAYICNNTFEKRDHVRSDIIFGSGTKYALVKDNRGLDTGLLSSRIECEFTTSSNQLNDIHIENCDMGRLEIGGTSSSSPYFSVFVENCRFSVHTILSGVTARVSDSDIRINDNDSRTWFNFVGSVSNTKIRIPYYDSSGTTGLRSLNLNRNGVGEEIDAEFRDCEFIIDNTALTSFPISSTSDTMLVNLVRQNITTEKVQAKFVNCKFDKRARENIKATGWPNLETQDCIFYAATTGYPAVFSGSNFTVSTTIIVNATTSPGAGGVPSVASNAFSVTNTLYPAKWTSINDKFNGPGDWFKLEDSGTNYPYELFVVGAYGSIQPDRFALTTASNITVLTGGVTTTFGRGANRPFTHGKVRSQRRFIGPSLNRNIGGLQGDVITETSGNTNSYRATYSSTVSVVWKDIS